MGEEGAQTAKCDLVRNHKMRNIFSQCIVMTFDCASSVEIQIIAKKNQLMFFNITTNIILQHLVRSISRHHYTHVQHIFHVDRFIM